MTKARTEFGLRILSDENVIEFVAFVPSGRCYRLGFGGARRTGVSAFTYNYARECWRERRKDWLPDYSGGAGVDVWLEPPTASKGTPE